MKIPAYHASRFVLAAGTMAALSILPRSASAQLVGGLMRPGAVTRGQSAPVSQSAPAQQSAPSQQFVPLRQSQPMQSGAIVRGNTPIYRRAPSYGSAYSNGPTYGQRPVSNPPFESGQQPGYGRGGSNNINSYGNGSYGSDPGRSYGPAATLPEEPYYPSYGGAYRGQPNLPPVGPGNGYFTHPIPPVGPGNGYFSGQSPVTGGGPARLGGYYYGNYCAVSIPHQTYRSVYSGYEGFPQYLSSPNVIVIDNAYAPVYATPYLPFYTPVYQTVYNQNNYYVATEGRVDDLQAGGERAKAALNHAYPADSFQAAFADIAHAWTDGDIDLVRRHLRDPDTRISVFLEGKYSYSIASSDFSQITRDALDRLHTVSFDFTRLRKAKNGDVTAYGAHVYRVAETGARDDNGTVPFDQAGTDSSSITSSNASPYDQSGDPALGAEKTVYISYTLRRYGSEWDVIATDSAAYDLAAASAKPVH